MRSFPMSISGLILAAAVLRVGAAGAAEVVIRAKTAARVSLDPGDGAWAAVDAARVPLVPQRFTAPNGGGAVAEVEVKGLVAGGTVFLRLEWQDQTHSTRIGPSGKFTDACAVEIPHAEGPPPSPFMGERGGPVDIWMWRGVAGVADRYDKPYSDFYRPGALYTVVPFADRPVQNLLAEGFGTLSENPTQDVDGAAVWEGGRWKVVLRRALASQGGRLIARNGTLPVAFAVWDGGTGERDGAKSLSPWHTLVLGGGKFSLPKSELEQGRRVFLRHGCVTCHGPGGKGGVKNANSQGGMVPPIERVAEGFNEEELKTVISEGRISVKEDAQGPQPPLHMTAWKEIMGPQEIDALVHYLFSLMPKGKKDEW